MRSGRFSIKLILYLLPMLTGLGMMLALAIYSGEAMPLSWVVQAQMHDPQAIYLPYDQDAIFAYKNMMLQARQPEVLLVGSSRILSFQSAFFNKNPDAFYNAGGSSWQPREITVLLDNLDPAHAPKILLIGVDFYWFNADWSGFASPGSLATGEISPDRVLRTTRQVMQQVFTRQISLNLILHPFESVYGNRAYGLTALTTGRGYRGDGSRQTNVVLLSSGEQAGLRMSHQVYLREQVAGYVQGTTVSEAALADLEHMLHTAEQLNIQVIGFLPPLLPAIYERIQANPDYAYFPLATQAVTQLFADHHLPFFDFTDPASAGGTYQEMVDGIHPSELLSLRVYAAMLRDLPDMLGAYSDLAALEKAIHAAPNPHEVFGS